MASISLISVVVFADNDVKCPKGTIIKGETTPEVREAWCEMNWKGKTVLHGPYRAWYPNGVLGTSGQYDKGKSVGKWYGWYDTGEKQGEEIFINGKKTTSKYWDKKGRSISAQEYDKSIKREK